VPKWDIDTILTVNLQGKVRSPTTCHMDYNIYIRPEIALVRRMLPAVVLQQYRNPSDPSADFSCSELVRWDVVVFARGSSGDRGVRIKIRVGFRRVAEP